MHFFAPDKHYWGGHGIVAGQTPLGAGLAFALKYKGLKGCAVTFLGDGAVNQGSFMETLNLVSLWNIPVVFVIENNGYSMGTSLKRSSAGENLAHRADGFDIAWEVCDGHDVFEVREAANRAMKRAREEMKPFLLEIRTYRYRGHEAEASTKFAEDSPYAPREEIQTDVYWEVDNDADNKLKGTYFFND
jgi:pyruvate dehydrogenase E1 component alpha subunit